MRMRPSSSGDFSVSSELDVQRGREDAGRQRTNQEFFKLRARVANIRQIRKRYQFEVRELPNCFKRSPFGFARAQEPGVYFRQVLIVVAGVRNQFPGSRWHLLQQGIDGCRVQSPGRQDAEGSLGCGKALLGHNALESWLQPSQQSHLDAPSERS